MRTFNQNKKLRALFTLLIFLSYFSISSLRAQVTIGSGLEPNNGSLLQLKEKDGDGNNSSKGLNLPRVWLSKTDKLYPMFLKNPDNPLSEEPADTYTPEKQAAVNAAHKGLMVYNVNPASKEGIYTWSGTEWVYSDGISPWYDVSTQTSATSNTDELYLTASVTIGKPITEGQNAQGALLQLLDSVPRVTRMDKPHNAYRGLAMPRVKLTEKNELYPMFLKNKEDLYNAPGQAFEHDYDTKKDDLKKSHRGLMVYNVTATDGFSPGIYVWDGTVWVAAQGGGSWRGLETGRPATSNDEDIYQAGRVIINYNKNDINIAARDTVAALNVLAENGNPLLPPKGALLSRVALKSRTDQETMIGKDRWDKLTAEQKEVALPAGLLVYNTGEGKIDEDNTFKVKGYMFWSGTEWRLISSATSAEPNAAISCGLASLDPEQVLVASTKIKDGTVLKIPYTVGNGGMYNGCVLYATNNTAGDPNGIKATLSDGLFENGAGYLAFTITGTPNNDQKTPQGITFNLQPFYDANPSIADVNRCASVTVGVEVKADLQSVAVMDHLKFTDGKNDGTGVPGYQTVVTTPDGKFSVRAFIVEYDFSKQNTTEKQGTYFHYVRSGSRPRSPDFCLQLQIRNNTSANVIIASQYTGVFYTDINSYLVLQPGKWSGDAGGTGLVVDKADPYWASYVSADKQGAGWTQTPQKMRPSFNNNYPYVDYPYDKQRGYFVYWGNRDILADFLRQTTWNVIDGDTSYTLNSYISVDAYEVGSVSTLTVPNNAFCPNGVCDRTSVSLKIDQIKTIKQE